ncbi:MAG: hypothetical protein QM773_15780 [Hyphomonadaceae bacterium]
MKLVLAAAAAISMLALSACGMLGGEEGPAPGSPAAKAAPALPPPSVPAPTPAAAQAREPEDLTPVPADQVKCIKPFILKTIEKDGQTEARCVAPSEAAPKPN